jgi:hypothetical protein
MNFTSIPQIGLAIVYDGKFQPTILHISGMILVIIGSFGYAILRWMQHRKERKLKKLGKTFSVDH